MKDEMRINVRVKAKLAEELKEVSEKLEVPTSIIVRDAVREKLAEMRRTHPLLVEGTKEVALVG